MQVMRPRLPRHSHFRSPSPLHHITITEPELEDHKAHLLLPIATTRRRVPAAGVGVSVVRSRVVRSSGLSASGEAFAGHVAAGLGL